MRKYHPCSKEFQDKAKELGLTGYEYSQKLREEGKLVDPTVIKRKEKEQFYKRSGFKNNSEYLDYRAVKRGYENNSEYVKILNWNNGRRSPMSDNDECSSYLGIHLAERGIARMILPKIFKCIKEMPFNYPAYEFIVDENTKIQVKARCKYVDVNGHVGWDYNINYNNVADYFLLIAFDNRIDLNLIYIWLIKKDDIIREREFYKRHHLTLTK